MNVNVIAAGVFNLVCCDSRPVFLPLSEVPHETLSACFHLKLQPALPMMLSFVSKLSQITGGSNSFVKIYIFLSNVNSISGNNPLHALLDVVIPDVDLQGAPLPNLLMQLSRSTKSHQEATDERDAVFTVVWMF